MTSGGRYQSRLFNFLHRQSLRLIDKSDRTLRQFKVATEWAVQVALYPIYLLLQTTQFAGKQLQQAVQQTLPRLQAGSDTQNNDPPTADTPIQSVLQTAQSFTLPETQLEFPIETETSVLPSLPKHWDLVVSLPTHELAVAETGNLVTHTPQTTTLQSATHSLPSTQTCRIQGVATLLKGRKLVLVTPENQLLDILSTEQQITLNQRIIWEVANYWHYQRKALQAQQKALRLHSLAKRQGMLPPIRWFWQAMDWVQTGPVASTINLFGESALAKSVQLPESRTLTAIPQIPIPDSLLTQLDRTVAEIEAGKLPAVSELTWTIDKGVPTGTPQRQQLIAWVKARFFGGLQKTSIPPENSSIGEYELWDAEMSASKGDPLRYDPWDQPPHAIAPNASSVEQETQKLKVQSLIQAAVDYFFGNRVSGAIRRNRIFLPDAEVQNWIEAAQDVEMNPQPGLLPLEMRSRHQLDLGKPTSIEVEDWLTFTDLFGETGTPNPPHQPATQISSTPSLPSAPPLPLAVEPVEHSLIRRSLSTLRQFLKPPSPIAEKPVDPETAEIVTVATRIIPVPTAAPPPANRAKPQSDKIPTSPQRQPSRENVPIRRTSQTPQAKPDWIETPATPVGYVKHPLEKFLEWLDRAMLWLESLLVKIWQGLQRLFS